MTTPGSTSTSFSLKQAFFEAFFVLLGVAFAMIANAWWESRQQDERTLVALATIENELQTNLEAIRASAKYHDEKMSMIFSWRESSPPTPREFPRGFVNSAQVLRVAWDTARTADALSEIDYDMLLTLSRAYADQARYEKQAEASGRLIYEAILDRGIDGLLADYSNLGAIISATAYREHQLVQQYEATLATLDEGGVVSKR